MNKTTFLLIGIIVGIMISFATYILTFDSSTLYQFSNADKRERFIEFLDKKGILFAYEIDHLKRHWVKPVQTDSLHEKEIEMELRRIREINKTGLRKSKGSE